MGLPKPDTIDNYILRFEGDVKKRLEDMRCMIQKAAPGATEAIKWGMPTFVHHGNLVCFAAFKNHISLFSLPSDTSSIQKELAAYTLGKGTIQFPNDKPLPLRLIAKMVKLRAKENLAKKAAKSGK